VAWFALAECISRGEKERALGVYRLLSHSFDDRALKVQLEGDILWSFRDEGAIKKYQEAAELYKKEGRQLEAAAVFEHITTLVPDSLYYRDVLMQLHLAMGNAAKVGNHALIFLEIAGAQQEFSRMNEVVSQLEQVLESSQCAQLYQQYVVSTLKYQETPHDSVLVYMKKAIDLLVAYNQSRVLQQFLSTIQVLNSRYYQQACRFIEHDKEAS
jgi:tetratricopeptide (TPR) repeat protein